MKRETMDQLLRLVDAQYQADLAKWRALLKEERKLRDDLKQIERDSKKAKEHLSAEAAYLKSFGADILWQRFLSQKKSMAERALSLVLARKADATHKLRKSHGRCDAVKALCTARDQALKVQRQKEEDRARGEMSVLQAMTRGL